MVQHATSTPQCFTDYNDAYQALKPSKEIEQQFAIAFEYAWNAYQNKNNPLLPHSLDVALILKQLQVDSTTIIAALLTDSRLREQFSYREVEQRFNTSIANIFVGVNKLNTSEEYIRLELEAPQQMELLRRMLLIMAEDIRGIVIKLAYRLQRLRLLAHHPIEHRHFLARETLDIFAPIANRLGLGQLKWELEDFAFRYLYPEEYKKIAKLLDATRIQREEYVENAKKVLKKSLKEAGITAVEVSGRAKHIYSIWKKMQKKNLEFEQLFDLQALRVIVEDTNNKTIDISTCYTILGIIHQLWRYIPKEFSDYIANPKTNGYQSLHTVVFGNENKTIEIQIRTQSMHKYAEFGFAAHWSYKEGMTQSQMAHENINNLRLLLENLQNNTEMDEPLQALSVAIASDYIYVITPKGKVVELAKGATPIDFAYTIHTNIGHFCRGAKVNGKITPLNKSLKTGDYVEILTAKSGGPSKDWLIPQYGYTKSARTRAKIRQWFRQQEAEQMENSGKIILEELIGKQNNKDIEKLLKELKFDKKSDFFTALAQGRIAKRQIQQLLEIQEAKEEKILALPDKRSTGNSDIYVHGVANLLTQFAACCQPVPKDPIIGYITKFHGVSIHRQDCINIKNLPTEKRQRLIEVSWSDSPEPKTYPVDIRIIAFDRKGLLRDITIALANENVNLLSTNTYTDPHERSAVLQIRLELQNADQLDKVIQKLHQVPSILEVLREGKNN